MKGWRPIYSEGDQVEEQLYDTKWGVVKLKKDEVKGPQIGEQRRIYVDIF